MRISRKGLSLSHVAAASLILAAGCTRTANENEKAGGGAISVKGSDTMVLLGQRWAEHYMKATPGVTVQVTGGGSGTGIAALINGTTDICQASRPMKPAEKAELQAKRSAAAVEVPVAVDALAVYVNDANPLQEISLPALSDLYRGKTTRWSALGGPERPVVLYGRENNSGTYSYFKEHVLGEQDFAATVQTLAGTSAVAHAVKGDPNGIGYGGIAYLEGVRALRVKKDDGSPAVAATLETAQDKTYPLARFLYFYMAGEPTGATRGFIDWVKSPPGQKVIEDVGYYPLPKR